MTDKAISEQAIQKHKVFWVTGLPGAGKTTFATALTSQLRMSHSNVIHLDGDQLREAFDNKNYSRDARVDIAHKYAALAKILVNQKQFVVVSTVSLFHQIHAWNRANLAGYTEIYLNPSLATLKQRNKKQLYDTNHSDQVNIVGKGIAPEYPLAPDFIFTNADLVQMDKDIRHILKLSGLLAQKSKAVEKYDNN